MAKFDSLDHAVQSAVCALVSTAFLFESMGRDEDSKCALELARDVVGLLQSTTVES